MRRQGLISAPKWHQVLVQLSRGFSLSAISFNSRISYSHVVHIKKELEKQKFIKRIPTPSPFGYLGSSGYKCTLTDKGITALQCCRSLLRIIGEEI